MASNQKTVIVTGASQGIGAAVVKAFLERGYNVVGTSRNATKSAEFKASDKLVLVDGDIGRKFGESHDVRDPSVSNLIFPRPAHWLLLPTLIWRPLHPARSS